MFNPLSGMACRQISVFGEEKTYARSVFLVKLGFRMSTNIEQLEQQLDSFDAAQRKDAVAKLWDLAKAGTAGRTSSSVPFPVHKCFSGS